MDKPPTLFQPAPGTGAQRALRLRARHPRFIYERFSLDRSAEALRARFHFRIEPDIEFAPETAFLGVDWSRVDSLPAGVLENLLFHLGLIETLSYWKAACSPEIQVVAGGLDPQQVAWFLDLLRHGMGEFFYVNRIDFRAPDFVRVVASGEAKRKSEVQIPRLASLAWDDSLIRAAPVLSGVEGTARERSENDSERDLVLTSGGKDSVVTLELLRETHSAPLLATGRAFDCLLLNPTEAALAVARQSVCSRPIIVRRTIDPHLLALNAAGYLNGHTPFSALLAVLGVTAAALYGYDRVIVSNERSAEEAGIEYLGEPINHQYSKSLQFETLFREYSQKYLAPGIEYFSLLRPLYELQIARRFAAYPAYFPLFKSCNRGMKDNAWCGRCSKCLFVYTALYPFVGREPMLAIFGEDLFAWDGAAEVMRALLGLDQLKPFECVGTREETLAALYLCAQKYRQQRLELPPALRAIEQDTLSRRTDLPELSRRILAAWSDDHHLPPELAAALREKINHR